MNNEQKVYSQEQLIPEDVGQKEHERDRAREAKTSMGRAVPPSDDADSGAPANGKALVADGNAGSNKSCAIGGEGVAEPGSSRLSSYPELCKGNDGKGDAGAGVEEPQGSTTSSSDDPPSGDERPETEIDPVGLFSGPLSPNYAYIDIRTRSQEDLRERRRVATLAKKEKADRIQKRKRDSRRAEGSVRGILPSAGDHVQHRNMVRQHAINFSDVGDGVFSFGSVSDSLNQPQVPSEGGETGETADQGQEEGDDDLVVTFSNLQVLTLAVKEEKPDWNELVSEGEAALEQALPESIAQQGPQSSNTAPHAPQPTLPPALSGSLGPSWKSPGYCAFGASDPAKTAQPLEVKSNHPTSTNLPIPPPVLLATPPALWGPPKMLRPPPGLSNIPLTPSSYIPPPYTQSQLVRVQTPRRDKSQPMLVDPALKGISPSHRQDRQDSPDKHDDDNNNNGGQGQKDEDKQDHGANQHKPEPQQEARNIADIPQHSAEGGQGQKGRTRTKAEKRRDCRQRQKAAAAKNKEDSAALALTLDQVLRSSEEKDRVAQAMGYDPSPAHPNTGEQAKKDIRDVVAAAARALHPVSTSREGAIPKTVKTAIAQQKKGGKRGAGEPSEASQQPKKVKQLSIYPPDYRAIRAAYLSGSSNVPNVSSGSHYDLITIKGEVTMLDLRGIRHAGIGIVGAGEVEWNIPSDWGATSPLLYPAGPKDNVRTLRTHVLARKGNSHELSTILPVTTKSLENWGAEPTREAPQIFSSMLNQCQYDIDSSKGNFSEFPQCVSCSQPHSRSEGPLNVLLTYSEVVATCFIPGGTQRYIGQPKDGMVLQSIDCFESVCLQGDLQARVYDLMLMLYGNTTRSMNIIVNLGADAILSGETGESVFHRLENIAQDLTWLGKSKSAGNLVFITPPFWCEDAVVLADKHNRGGPVPVSSYAEFSSLTKLIVSSNKRKANETARSASKSWLSLRSIPAWENFVFNSVCESVVDQNGNMRRTRRVSITNNVASARAGRECDLKGVPLDTRVLFLKQKPLLELVTQTFRYLNAIQ